MVIRDPRRDPISEPENTSESVKAVIGRNVARIRSGRGMAVRELAEEAGVSAAFISQVEHSSALPSVATLVRIAQALRTNIGDLFDASHTPGRVVKADDRAPYVYPERGITEAKVSSDPSGRLEVLWIELDVGGGTGAELFAHGADSEFVFVLRGTAAVTVGADVHHLSAGDSLTFPGAELHGSQNVGDEVAELLWVQTPASY